MQTSPALSVEATVAPAPVSPVKRARRWVAGIFAFLAVLVSPGVAFAQTTPTLPDPGATSNQLVNQGGSQLATAVLAVLPAVITLTVLFWAINFALKKIGVRGRAANVH